MRSYVFEEQLLRSAITHNQCSEFSRLERALVDACAVELYVFMRRPRAFHVRFTCGKKVRMKRENDIGSHFFLMMWSQKKNITTLLSRSCVIGLLRFEWILIGVTSFSWKGKKYIYIYLHLPPNFVEHIFNPGIVFFIYDSCAVFIVKKKEWSSSTKYAELSLKLFSHLWFLFDKSNTLSRSQRETTRSQLYGLTYTWF